MLKSLFIQAWRDNQRVCPGVRIESVLRWKNFWNSAYLSCLEVFLEKRV